MDFRTKIRVIIKTLIENIHERRKLILALSCAVVFITTYVLILPAFTLDMEEAAEQGGIDVPAVEQSVDAASKEAIADELQPKESEDSKTVKQSKESSEITLQNDENEDYSVAVEGKDAGLSEDMSVEVREIDQSSKELKKEYNSLYSDALEAVQKDEGLDTPSEFAFAKFYDISLMDGKKAVEPDSSVDVKISFGKDLQKELKVADIDRVYIVHFAVDKDTGEVTPEVLDTESTDITVENDKVTEAAFTTDSFSVFAVVYTVDFEYEIDGKVFSLSIHGEDSISLKALVEALHVYEKRSSVTEVESTDLDTDRETSSETSGPNEALDAFMADITEVTFSNPELLAVVPVEEDSTLGQLKFDNEITQQFSLNRPQAEVEERNAATYTAGDWVLISLQPFDTEESLTVTLATEETFTISVTDAQDAVMNPDGVTVQTISNPAGTNINLFDFWVDTDLRYNDGRSAWPGYYDGWNPSAQALGGTGNEAGINAGHALKFSPAWEHTVYNGTKDGGTSHNVDRTYGLNSYTGGSTPLPGIADNALVNGFPRLSNNGELGSDGESLAYLFDPQYENAYRSAYTGVDQLLYVDKEGYYTFDSRDYYARFNDSTNTFTVTEQTSNDPNLRGFWPFNDQASQTRNFWLGMHVNTQFSMPAGGQVLNPSHELKPMQFEFSGDDDVWIYIDGVLVGDAGGVHNRVEVDINFQTGLVSVSGQDPKYLDEYFKEAGKYNPDDWNGHTFKDNSYHTFDFFYLERGGEESNLYIHYNLVSTADFTAHKSFHGTDEEDLLKRDQFKFELIGLDGKYRSRWSEEAGGYVLVQKDTDSKAIMPHAEAGGEGTVESPSYQDNTTTVLSDGTSIGSQTYITGDTEDGNVTFGAAIISEQDMHETDEGNSPVYKYIIREIVPDDAVNEDNVRWADATDEQRAAGGFVYDDIIYDGTVYYMTGRVISWTETDPRGQEYTRYGLSKTYYTDDTYTTVKEDTSFISFVNTFNATHGNVDFDKVDQNGDPLEGATFALFRDEACTIPAKAIDEDNRPWTAASDSDGKVSFENVRTGTYYMKETVAPEGYALDETIYKVVIEDAADQTKKSVITVLGDEEQTPVTEIHNAEDGKLYLVKKWLNSAGVETSGGSHTANVNLYRKIDDSTVPTSSTVTVIYHRDGAGWNLNVGGDRTAVIVEDASSFDLTWHLGNEAKHRLHDMTVNGVLYPDAEGNVIDTGHGKIQWIAWDEQASTSRLYVSEITGDLYIEFQSNCDWFDVKPADPPNNGVHNVVPFTPPEIDTVPELIGMVSLTPDNDWNVIKTIGGTLSNYQAQGYDLPATSDDGYRYLYYIVELNKDDQEIEIGDSPLEGYYLSGYSANNNTGISNQGVITVYNRAERTNTISVVIRKTDNAENSTNYLDGAVFKLMYRSDSSGTFTNVSNESVPELDSESQFTVPAASITLTGLVDGQYQLQEISPPSGYVITNSTPVTFTVAGGAITSTEGTITGVRYTAASETSDAEFIIPNEPGAALPNTGGPGTRLFTILGSILILGAGVLLWRRRRTI